VKAGRLITEPSSIYRLGDDISGVEENSKDLLYDRVEAEVTFSEFFFYNSL